MSFTITGTIVEIKPTQQVTETFQKREFVVLAVETVGDKQYDNYPKFQVTQNKCDLLDAFVEGQEVTVSFNVKGNKWEKEGNTNYFVSLQAWKIEGTNSATVEDQPEANEGQTNNDELPF